MTSTPDAGQAEFHKDDTTCCYYDSHDSCLATQNRLAVLTYSMRNRSRTIIDNEFLRGRSMVRTREIADGQSLLPFLPKLASSGCSYSTLSTATLAWSGRFLLSQYSYRLRLEKLITRKPAYHKPSTIPRSRMKTPLSSLYKGYRKAVLGGVSKWGGGGGRGYLCLV